jgi:hypothetical protein
MRLFKCDTKTVTMKIVDLPRSSYHYVPPSKLQTVLTLVGIVIVALAWSLF